MTPTEWNELKSKLLEVYIENAALMKILSWDSETYSHHCIEQCLNGKSKWNIGPFKNLKKRRTRYFHFLTINYNEDVISTSLGDPLLLLKKMAGWACVLNYAYAFEWRNHLEKTGLHCHVILQGETKYITRNCKSLKPIGYIKLCEKFNTLKKYPMKYLTDKIDYISGKTFDPSKSLSKLGDQKLRLEFNLPSKTTF